MIAKHLTTKNLFRVVYLCLLGVLLPHTQWAFSKFEPPTAWGAGVAWAAAIFFEATIAVVTERLAERLSKTPNYQSGYVAWRKFSYRYLNPYSVILGIALLVSTAANMAHAVEYGAQMAIFAQWGVPAAVYAATFGAILPVSSLVFAYVLSNEQPGEVEEDPQLVEAKGLVKELRSKVQQAEQAARQAERRAEEAEQRFAAAGDLFAKLFAEEKRTRVLAIHRQWPTLPQAAIAVIAATSPSHVSEILKDNEA